MADSNKKKGDEVADIIKDAMDCLKNYEEDNDANIQRAKQAIEFRSLDQWPTAIKKDREGNDQEGGSRPCPVMDKTNQYIRQIINEERQNRAAVKVRPVDDFADKKTADIFTGLIRHIEDQSEAIEAYTTAGEHAIDGGFGYFRMVPEYCDDMSFDQDIRIKRIHNRFSVALGPHCETDGSDAKEGVIWEDVPRSTFSKEYPGKKEVDFTDGDAWADKDSIRVGEYFCIKEQALKIHMMEDGTVLTDEDLKEFQKVAPQIQPIDSRDTVKKTVYWYKLTREEILEETTLPGEYIPIIKVTGNEITQPDGKIRLSGAVEAMQDPQRLHNYAVAGFIEHVALAPRAPWVAGEEAIEGYEDDYAVANRLPISVLKYKQYGENGEALDAPTRTPPPGVSTGWQAMLQNTEHAIEASIGMYGPSVGAKSQEKSGIALQEQKAQGMIGNYHYPDNLARSIQHCGRILLQWIPTYYDRTRKARILGEEGNVDTVELNPEQETSIMEYEDEAGEKHTSYNLNVGKYDLTVSTGPSYTSRRQEAADQQLQVIQARPEMLDIIGDIAFKNMDTPGSDAIADRLQALLPPEIQQLEAEKGDAPVDPQTRMMRQQLEQAAAQLEEREMQLAQIEQQITQAKAEVEAGQKDVESKLRLLQAERKTVTAEVRAQKAEMKEQARELMNGLEKEAHQIDMENRELELREMEAGVGLENDRALTQQTMMAVEQITETIMGLNEQLEQMRAMINTPKTISMQRDKKGNLVSVNGQAVSYDENGNIIGVEGLH